jgi:hypothetical protein
VGFLRTWAPPGVLTALVGFVFLVLRGFGPESTLQKFHVAAANRDFKTLQLLSSQASSPDELMLIQNQVMDFARRGYRYEVRSIQPQARNVAGVVRKDNVVALVNYVQPEGRTKIPMLFVLEKQSSRWVVNPKASLNLMRQVTSAPGTRF